MTEPAVWRVGVDIGGTFTDVVAYGPDASAPRRAKVPSVPADPLAGLRKGLDAVGLPWENVADLIHGTTLVTNAIVENRLARIVLLCTAGFSDTLAIGRQNRRELYRLDLPPKAEPLVPDERRLEVVERITHDGVIEIPLGDESVEAALASAEALGAEALAISLLHGYANPSHENTLGERARRVTPHVSLSHRVNPEAREYERTVSTVLNAGVMPLVAGYLDRLEEARPADSRLHLFHSSGGMVPPEALRERPLALALSGPAAGVAASARIAADLELDRVISFDMGGTTTDVCLVLDGRSELRSSHQLAGHPLRQPMVAVESIGAGGGSIARAQNSGLRIGPESAGATPGPACYGQGGDQATVTDANLALGYLSGTRLLGGEIRLQPEAAERALSALGNTLGAHGPALALGIHRVANAAMMRALRRVTVERGIDGRDCALLAFGGAGPMHAAGLAREFGIRHVVVPALSSLFSAFGCVAAELSYSQQRTVRMASEHWDSDRFETLRDALVEQIAAPLRAAGHDADAFRREDVAAVRYAGQSYAIDVPIAGRAEPQALGRDFRAIHERLYGFATDEPWELEGLRITLAAPEAFSLESVAPSGDSDPAPSAVVDCWFDSEAALPTPRYERDRLGAGARLAGPAIVEDDWSTIVLPPHTNAEVDAAGHIHLRLEAA